MTQLDTMTRREMMRLSASAAAIALIANPLRAQVGAVAVGYGTDPNLLAGGKPPWKTSLTKLQLATVRAVCDVIIPADATSKSAGQVRVHDFIDQWVSGPYPLLQLHRQIITTGIEDLNKKAKARHKASFPKLGPAQKMALLREVHVNNDVETIYDVRDFFGVMRQLTIAGYYTTKAGMDDLKYIGNVPLKSFDGPPPAVMKKLKLAK